MPLPDTFLQELKMKTDIEDVVSTYVTLKKRGNTYVGICPFHNEKTPSFTVYPETQSFYCFGCGAGGDAVGFIRKIENLDYMDAVKSLAQRAGMQLPEDGYDDSIGKKRRRLYEINRAAARFFHSYMMSEQGQAGLQYYLGRGLTRKTITRFGLGYAPDAWDLLLKHLKEEHFSIAEMLEAGLIRKTQRGSYIDTFRKRVMTPIIDIRGNVIAFGGRVLDDTKPKYINTSDTLIYKKTNELFGMNLAKDSGTETLILCEGYMDVIAMHQAGFTNAVAGCGTALTNEQVRLISRYAKEVVLAYDNDEAGRKALDKAINLFKQTEVKIRVPSLSGGKDPDEIIKNVGRDRFAAMLDGSSNEIEYALIKLREQFNLRSTQGKLEFMNEAIKVLSTASPIERDLYASRLAEELDIDKGSVKAQLEDYVKRRRRYDRRRNMQNIVSEDMRNNSRESYEMGASTKKLKAEYRLIGLLLKYPAKFDVRMGFDAAKLSEGFVRTVLTQTLRLIDDGASTDLINFSQFLSESELAKLSGILAKFNASLNPTEEMRDCIHVINEEYDRNANADKLTNLQDNAVFSEKFNQLKNKKNKA